MASDILSLQWLEHSNIFNGAIIALRNKSTFTDATLACDGKFYPVHKLVLSTCSDYFRTIFEWTPSVNPVVIINNISCRDLEPLLDFMYLGETSVQESHIHDVMKAAESLCVKGLSVTREDSTLHKNLNSANSDLKEKLSKDKQQKVDQSPKDKNVKNIVKPTANSNPNFHQQSPHLLSPKSSHSQYIPPLLQASGAPYASPISSYPASILQLQSGALQSPVMKPTIPTSQFNPVNSSALQFAADAHQMASIQQALNNNMRSLETPKPFLVASQQKTPSMKYSEPQIAKSTTSSTSNSCKPQPLGNANQCDIKENYNFGLSSNLSESQNMYGERPNLSQLQEDSKSRAIPNNEKAENILDEYNFKEEPANDDGNRQGHSENISNVPTDNAAAGFPPTKEDVNAMMYNFSEEGNPEVDASQLKFYKEKSPRVYSRGSSTSGMNRQFSDDESLDPVGELLSEALMKEEPVDLNRFVCDLCSRTFKRSDQLRRHQRSSTCNKPYICTFCKSEHKTYKELIEHRKCHATFQCDQCDFVTTRNENLRRHKRTHSLGHKGYKCPHIGCTYSASRNNLLTSHINNKHPSDGASTSQVNQRR